MTEKSYELTLDELKALYADGKFTGSDLLVKNNLGYTVLHYLANHKDALSIFQWLADLKWITKDDLFIKNDLGTTVLDCLGANENALDILQGLKELTWITKNDLFIKNDLGTTVLDWLNNKNKNKILALFDDEETSSAGKKANITDEMINKIREHLKAINNILTFNEE